jgi:signal peptidase II
MTPAHNLRIATLLPVLGCTVGCDQTTKRLARANLNQADAITVFHGFGELRLAENHGAFPSLGAALPAPVRKVVFTKGVGAVVAALFGYYLSGRTRLGGMALTGLALVAAGGMSNCIDCTVRDGQATDFITLRFGPFQTGIFNAADMVVMSGAGLLALALGNPGRWTAGKTPAAARNPAP